MKISVAACELPHPEGTAAGRDLWAWCEGLRSLGHDVDAWVWFRSPSSPEGPVPDWCRVEPFEPGAMWGRHLRALRRPRQEVARAGWTPQPGAIAVADHLWSAGAVAGLPRSVATLHFRALADAWAVGRIPTPADIQMARAERLAGRQAALVLTYSSRAARGLRRPTAVVPIAYPAPLGAVPSVDHPVAALLADWSWPPNRMALAWLLAAWPDVHRAVPAARMVLAGRHLDRIGVGTVPGVELRGPVARSADLLEEAAVIAFPCPTSTGPKVKVLEALAHGIPVLTTAAGVEGICESGLEGIGGGGLEAGGGVTAPGAVVTDQRRFASELVSLLNDPARRASLGAAGRAAVVAHHSPVAAARARFDAFSTTFGAEAAAADGAATGPERTDQDHSVGGPQGYDGVPA